MRPRNRWLNFLPLLPINRQSESSASSKEKRRKVKERSMQPRLEVLEERTLLSIGTLGIPNWQPLASGPIGYGGNVDLNGDKNPGLRGGAGDIESGAVQAIVADPDPANAGHLYVGTVNGGIWETQNATAAAPVWQALTDQFPSLAIASLALSPVKSPLNKLVLYAGTGSFSSFY